MIRLTRFFATDTHTGIARRTALTAYSIRVGSAGIAYLVQIALARWLGAHHYGVYVMVWTWVLILGHIATLGLSVIPELFIPTYTQNNQPALLRGYTAYVRVATFLSAAFVGLIGYLGLQFFGSALEAYYLWPLYLAFICLPFFTITETFDGISRCYNAAGIALGPPYLLRPLLIVAFMAIGHMLGAEPTATNAMKAALLACIVAAALQSVLVTRLLSKNVAPGPRVFEQSRWLKAALPLFLAEAARVLLQNIDVLAVARFEEPTAVAIYFAVTKTLALAIFVNFAIAAAVSHRFTEYHVSGDTARLKAFIAQSSLWSFAATLIAVILMLSIGQGFLYLFGPAYTSGFPLMFVLGGGILVRSMIGPADRLLGLLGHQILLAKIVAATLCLAAALLFILVPLYGTMGAAIAMSGASLFETALLAYFVKHRLGLPVGFWHHNALPS